MAEVTKKLKSSDSKKVQKENQLFAHVVKWSSKNMMAQKIL